MVAALYWQKRHDPEMSKRDAEISRTRQCALTRDTRPVDDLIRFALGPDGVLAPDVDAKAPGRGVWISLSKQAVAEAETKKTFSRSLKQPVTVPQDLAQLVQTRLEQRLLGTLGLARKAGQLVTGATKTRAAIEKPGIAALFTATDAAPDGRQKMVSTARARAEGGPTPHFELLTSVQMGLALGLENVIHAAIIKGAASKSALNRAKRLAEYITPTALSTGDQKDLPDQGEENTLV